MVKHYIFNLPSELNCSCYVYLLYQQFYKVFVDRLWSVGLLKGRARKSLMRCDYFLPCFNLDHFLLTRAN